jgi:ABC transporter substrate binding protein (PQQ-dependent alcohol dehydrogenase system)
MIFLMALVFSFVTFSDLHGRERTAEELKEREKIEEDKKEIREEKRKKAKGKKEKKFEKLSVVFFMQEKAIPPALSNLDPILKDEGKYGAVIGVEDNNTTGIFTGQEFDLKEVYVPIKGDYVESFKQLISQGYTFFIVNLPAGKLAKIASLAESKNVLIFNTSASDNILRTKACHTNVFHVAPSRAMKTDALAQFLVKKNWKKWRLVVGPKKADKLFARSIEASAKKYGAKIVEKKIWDLGPDMRRTAQAEVPAFTKGKKYDILLIADEIGEFGEYLVYNTWYPNLVAGTQGLVPTAWHRTHEKWGATQMQNRFRRKAGRWMTSTDYAAWVAARTIGEASARIKSFDSAKIRNYILSEDFEIAAYKGIKVTYRKWSQQLRQRILLASPRSLVSVSPQKEFLHKFSEMDTLGFDVSESSCAF